ncbi:ABC transporter permease [Paenibacillus anseongense]|uniref:ABC transporter permease n=1 Tax=Paenibacillus anseongense TaxID=2682845 RepID=UPI002DB776E1|nr:ABC transporter permease subunit [Paenibacillus anseongense]MEC0271372.1 ABC transporter permease subunit [Paenibacillus anseongense]
MAASLRRTIAKDLFLYALVAPGLLYFLIFKYVPMWGVMISFQNYSPFLGFFKSEWVGFEHFARLFSNADFYMLFRNTMAINVLSLVFFFPLPIIVALLLNELQREWFKKSLQSVVYLPHFLSWVVIVGLSLLLLSKEHGVLNQLLELVGWGPIEFLTEPKYFWALLTGQTIWKELGWGTVIFLAAIAGVDPQLYEAAKMDGAGRIRMMWNVTLPSIRNVIIILLILRIGHMMDVGFEQVFLMMNGAVADVAEVFDTYVFRVGIKQGDFSYSTAVGLFKSIVGLVLVIGANKLSKKFGEEGVY